jgi:hypothetical protein
MCDERIISISAIPRFFLEFQKHNEIYLKESDSAATRADNGFGNATENMEEKTG